MSKLKFSKGKFSKFISSKGFYVAIAVCLVGAGAATWLAVDRTITGIEDANSRMIQEDRFEDFPRVEEAETKKPDVPRPSSEASSSSSTAPSSSAPSSPSSEQPQESSAVSAASEASAESPVTPTLVYTLPVHGTISNPYSGGELVKNVTLNDWRTHDGIDIIAARGDAIYAAADGVVTEIRQDTLWGTVMTVDHADGMQTMYYGLHTEIPVKEGESVMVKQVIGVLDAIPCEIEQESHLHFAMKKDGAWIDPMSILTNS